MKNVALLFREWFADDFRRLAILPVAVAMAVAVVSGCTSALVGAQRGANGRWLLWKHRDSGHPDNYVKAFAATDSTLAYVALFNAADTASSEAWIGFNAAGFAVMNTASYNIPAPDKDWQDREGFLMSEALRRCRTIEDFHRMLLGHPGPRGVQANFGVFDAEGHGAYFETSDKSVAVFPLDSVAATPEVGARNDSGGILTRTNYSLSGGPRKRLGLSRHRAENHLLDSLMATDRPWASHGEVAAEDFIETLSRSLYLPEKGVDLLDGVAPLYPDNGDVIPRRSSCASVVIEGPLPGEDPARTMIMWTAIGFPTLSIVEPATIDSVPATLRPTATGNHSPLCDSINILRQQAFVTVPLRNASRSQSHQFNLRLLRTEIPRRRELSFQRYLPARKRRDSHPAINTGQPSTP